MSKKDIPKHWELKKLGEVCFTTSGGTPNRGNSKFYQGNIPWVKSGELDRGLILDTEEKISEEAIKNSSAKVFPKGTLLIALYGATIGKLAFLGIDAATNQAVCGIYKNENIDSNYLFNFLFYKKPSLVKQGIGGAQPNISQGILKNLDLPIPPIAEQQVIVAKIEELLSNLENGKEQLQTAHQQLKVYRQSLLKWAFEGKLTNKNVKEGELPKEWKQVKIKDVAATFGGYAFKSGEFLAQGKYQVLRMGNVRPGIIRYSESPVYLNNVDENVLSRALLQLNDVIITQTGTRKKRDYGFTVLIQKPNLLLNQRIASIRFYEKYLPKFFLYFSWTNLFKDQFFANETGNVGQGNVGMKAVTETLIPFPSIEEQQLIVEELESKLTVCDKIEETISQSLQQAEILKQSILKQAFEGKLI
jgi:type I restriction enzyme S subunit